MSEVRKQGNAEVWEEGRKEGQSKAPAQQIQDEQEQDVFRREDETFSREQGTRGLDVGQEQ
eukprot:766138-Hanusia_phi.AAC.1